jgi:hypothetical protein
MRMWMVDPAIMCRQHLLGEHRELHALYGVFSKRMSWDLSGYIRNNLIEPISLWHRHDELVAEMEARGYNHRSPLPHWWELGHLLPYEYAKAFVNRERSLEILLGRCVECKDRHATVEKERR